MRVKIILQAVGALALAGFIAVEGDDIKTRVLDGKSENYTVMVASWSRPADRCNRTDQSRRRRDSSCL